MTTYNREDLNKDWEFKIVRNEYGVFRKPEKLQQLLDEESIAGWEMVEKLDDRRVRFKRRNNARNNDHMLPPGIDPYRSRFGGTGRATMIALIAGFVTLTVGLAVFFIFVENSGGSTSDTWVTVTALPIVLIMIILGIVVALRARQ